MNEFTGNISIASSQGLKNSAQGSVKNEGKNIYAGKEESNRWKTNEIRGQTGDSISKGIKTDMLYMGK